MKEKVVVTLVVFVALGLAAFIAHTVTPEFSQEERIEREGYVVAATPDIPYVVSIENEDGVLKEVDIADWPTYRNDFFKFQFKYPPNYSVVPRIDSASASGEEGWLTYFSVQLPNHVEEARDGDGEWQVISGTLTSRQTEQYFDVMQDFSRSLGENESEVEVQNARGESRTIWIEEGYGYLQWHLISLNDKLYMRLFNSQNLENEDLALFHKLVASFEFFEQ